MTLPYGWLEVLRRAARYVISRQYNGKTWEVDELVGEAWLNSISRLPDTYPISGVFSIASMSMRQYVGGKKKTRQAGFRDLDRRTKSLFNEEGTVDWGHYTKPPIYTYDDVDDVLHWLHTIPVQHRSKVLDRLAGMAMEEIGRRHGVSESRICQIFKEIRL